MKDIGHLVPETRLDREIIAELARLAHLSRQPGEPRLVGCASSLPDEEGRVRFISHRPVPHDMSVWFYVSINPSAHLRPAPEPAE